MRVPIGTADRVVIVGAGPAGLHAAFRLRQRGVGRIRILERSHRIGGKSWTREHDGLRYDVGTCFLHNRYVETRALIRQLGLRPSRPMAEGAAILRSDFSSFPRQALLPTLRSLWRYARIRERLLGPETVGLPARPGEAALDELALPALTFFERHGLFPILERNFRTGFSAQGYGYLEDASALYALLWFEPKVLRALVLSTATMVASDVHPRLWAPFTVTHELPDGFGTLMERLAEQLAVPIETGVEIEGIERDPVVVRFRDAAGERRETEADWLLWAAPLPAARAVLQDPAPHEAGWFAAQTSSTLTTTAYTDTPVPNYTAKGRRCLYFQDRTTPRWSGRWYGDRVMKAIDAAGPRGRREHRLAYQYSSRPIDHPESSAERMLARLQEDLEEAGRTEAKILEHEGRPFQMRWSYFPRFTAEAVRRGVHWDVLRRQGQRRTVWLGSSVWFEAVEHVFRYNRAVLG